MSSKETKSGVNQDLSDKKVINIKNNSKKVDAAIKKGIQLNEELENEDQIKEFTIKILNTDNQKLMELTSAIRMSRAAMIEYSIEYVYYCINRLKLNLDEIIQKMGGLGGNSNSDSSVLYNLKLDIVTLHKIKKIGMEERVNDCAILGIRLLYQNNCTVRELEKTSEISQ